MPTGQYDLGNSSLRISSQVDLSSVKLNINGNHYNCTLVDESRPQTQMLWGRLVLLPWTAL